MYSKFVYMYREDILTGIKRSLDRSDQGQRDQEQRIAVRGHLLSDIAFYRGFTCSRDHDDEPWMINNELAATWNNMHYDGLGTTLASAYEAMLRIAIRHDYDRTWETGK